MAKYAINSSGEASMRKLAADISQCSNDTITAYKLLENETISIEDGLGIYATEVFELVDKCRSSLDACISDINYLAHIIVKKADEISELMTIGFDINASENSGIRQPMQYMEWSDAEYGDVFDKIQIANRNSDFLEWTGESGNSLRIPKDKSGELLQQLNTYGVGGIPYVGGNVDFSKVSKFEVEFADADELYLALGTSIKFGDLMTDDSMKSRSEFNGIIRRKWQAMAKQQIVDRILTDKQFAIAFSAKTGVNTELVTSVSHLESELKNNGLTLHETTDCKKIQFVPTKIHDTFKHAGGTAEMLERLINGDIHFKVGI